MTRFSGGGSRVSLARAQQLGIRTSRVSSWSRSNSFNYAVRATAIIIAILIINSLISFTVILSRIDVLRQNSDANNISTGKTNNESTHIISSASIAEVKKNVCSSRHRHKWRGDFNRYFDESHEAIPTFAVVLTVNDGFWDLFVNWYSYFQDRVANKSDRPMLVIIAEDMTIYEKLKTWSKSKTSTIILQRYIFSDNASSFARAEDYDSVAYRSLVSSRATHFLNLICSLGGGGLGSAVKKGIPLEVKKREGLVILYSDVDTVWLKDPFPYIQTKLFGPDYSDRGVQQKPNYDILAAVDRDEYHKVSPYYCTGFQVISQTSESIAFLSLWEKELSSNPQINQPSFNILLRSPELPEIRHDGLGENEFPSGKLYFDEWMKEGAEVERRKKKDTIVVHNNYIVGHDAKVKRFQEHGLWMTEV